MRLLCLLLFVCFHGVAQTSSNTPPGDYEGISGNPYFVKDWAQGVIRFTSGKVTDKFKLRFNTAQNRLLLQFSGSTFAAESSILEFVIYSKNKKDSFLFRKGFPTTDRGNEETFYQVLEKGKATLLQLVTKDIVVEKEVLATKVKRHYQDVNLFYLLHNGAMHKIERETTPLEGILSDRREELKNYITAQQLKMRTSEDFVNVVRKYNEFP